MLADGAVEHAGLIPHGWDDAEEVEAGLVLIVDRIVSDAGEGAPVDDKEGELLSAAAHDLGGCSLLPLRRAAVEEAARRIVHGTGEHASERKRELVERCNPRAELVVLVAQHALAGEEVGVGDAEAGGLKGAVEIDHEVVLRRERDDVTIPVHHGLVVLSMKSILTSAMPHPW